MARGMWSVARPYTVPSAQSPIVDPANGAITQVWLGLIREMIDKGLRPELAPGRMDLFKLSAATLADDTCFVLAGATAGLGLGDYAGWAICNGNNGTDDWSDRYPRCNIAGGSALSGADDDTHTHSVDVPDHGHANDFAVDSHVLDSTEVPATDIGPAAAVDVEMDAAAGAARRNLAYTASNGAGNKLQVQGGGLGHIHPLSGSVTATDIPAFDSAAAGGATGNRPLSRDCVMMMRV